METVFFYALWKRILWFVASIFTRTCIGKFAPLDTSAPTCSSCRIQNTLPLPLLPRLALLLRHILSHISLATVRTKIRWPSENRLLRNKGDISSDKFNCGELSTKLQRYRERYPKKMISQKDTSFRRGNGTSV